MAKNLIDLALNASAEIRLAATRYIFNRLDGMPKGSDGVVERALVSRVQIIEYGPDGVRRAIGIDIGTRPMALPEPDNEHDGQDGEDSEREPLDGT